jgi:hypothetical protein
MSDLLLDHLYLVICAAAVVSAGLVVWISRRPVRGLYLTVFATSTLITPYLPVVREKFTAVEGLMLLTWAAMLLRRTTWRTRAGSLRHPQKICLVWGWSFVGWVLVSFYVNNILMEQGLGNEGLIGSIVESANYLYGFLMFRTVLRLVDDWDKWNGCLSAWILGAALASLVGVLAVAGVAPSWAYEAFTGRISSTLRNENQVPSFLLPIFVAVVFMAVRNSQGFWKRVLLVALAAGMLITTFGTGSRTAMAMLGLCLAGVYFLTLREWPHRIFNRVLLAQLAFAMVAGVTLYVAAVIAAYEGDYALGRTPAWQRPVVMLFDWSQGNRALDETRERQMDVVAEHLLDRPVLGAGPKLTGIRYDVAEIHDTYVGVLMDAGFPGCALFVLWLLYTLRLGWRAGAACRDPYRRLMVLSLCIGMGTLMIYSMFMFGLRQRNLWILAGLLAAVPRLADKPADAGANGSSSTHSTPALASLPRA